MSRGVFGGRGRERAVLVGGLVSAAALAAAALYAPADPAVLGAAIVARASGEVADGIALEWTRLARDGDLVAGPERERFTWHDGDEPRELAPRRDLRDLRNLLDLRDPDPARYQAFDLLFAAARQREVAGELAAARGLVADALGRAHDEARGADARLAEIRLAALAGDADAAWEGWRALDDEVDGLMARDGTSVLLLGALSALPALSSDEEPSASGRGDPPREPGTSDTADVSDGSGGPARGHAGRTGVLRERIGALWASDELALPGDGRTPRDAQELLAGADPTRAALARELERFGALPDTVRAAEERARARAALAVVGARPFFRVEDTAVELADLGDHVAARRSGAGGTAAVELRIAPREELESELLAAASELVPAGFHVSFAPAAERAQARGVDGADGGELVRARTALAGDAFGFELRHDDPPALARAETARVAALQVGLFVLAGLVAGMSVFTWRALGSERRLAGLRSAFVASVSHELRTPLASILLMAENLEAGRVPDDARGRYHRLIRREAQRLRRLVDDVLDVSRLERGEAPRLRAEDLDVAAFLRALEAEARERVEADGGALAFHAAGVPDRLHADGEALRRAVLNLVDNAMKHSGTKEVEVTARADDAELVLAVRDRGRGVPAAHAEEIFAPFARLAAPRGAGGLDGGAVQGAGLGLAIVREIARAHGGTALVRAPADGPGALFEVRLPLDGDTEGTR